MNPQTRSWRDSVSTVAFGLSLTAFMATSLFVTVGINPKTEGYGNLPWFYAVGCSLISGIMYAISRRFVNHTLSPSA